MKNITQYLVYGISWIYLTIVHVSYAQAPITPRFDIDSVNINLMGNVTEYTCGVSSSNLQKEIKLGTVLVKQLSTVGNQSTPVPIRFEMTNCPPSGTLTMSFNGVNDPVNADFLAISNVSNKAENVAIEIRDQDKKRLALGKKSQPFIADSSGKALAIFYANYITTQSSAKAGIANATATFSIEYQ